MNKLVSYTDPQLCTYGGDLTKSWFVYFDITNNLTGETQRKQYRGGINFLNDYRERLSEGEALLEFWKQNLKNGWHPFKINAPDLKNFSFNGALNWAYEKCKVSASTKKAYKTTKKYVEKAATKLQLAHVHIHQIKRQHIKMIMEQVQTDRKLSNGGYNKHVGYLSAILGQLIQWDIIEHNPADKISRLKDVERQKFKPYTEDEKKAIYEYIFMNHYNYFVYLMVIYHTGIRPKEVLALKIKDVDLITSTITIQPWLDEENSKTKNIRVVPINPHLLPFLRELELENYPSNYFVFGSPFPSGKGNKGSVKGGLKGSFHPEYFKPSTTMVKRDTTTRLWKKIVMEKLGIDKYQYAMKHTGADDKILAGIDLDALRELYGHSSKFMTEKYARKIKEVYRDQIVNKSPAFVK